MNIGTNQSVWDVFRDDQCRFVFGNYYQEDMFEEIDEEEEKEVDEINNKNNKTKPSVDEQKQYEITRKQSNVIPLNEKTLENEFMRVFELVNDDFICFQPKLVPMIPGDDPNVIHKVSEFGDDY